MLEPQAIVTKTFHKIVSEGESSFTIEVPRSYGSLTLPNSEVKYRQFYFSELHLIPGFYKQRAAQLGLDDEEEDDSGVELEFRFSYAISPDLFKNAAGLDDVKFEHGLRANRIDALIKAVNAHFEASKPEGVEQAVFFIDWIDVEWGNESYEEDPALLEMLDPKVVVPPMVLMYYGTNDYSDAAHFNALEPSTRKIPGVNNFKFPLLAFESEELFGNIRLRMNFAPNTKVIFSTNTLLQQLGFSNEQIGTPRDRNRYSFENRNHDVYMSFVAENMIRNNGIIKGTSTTIFPVVGSKTFQSDWTKIKAKMSQFNSNEQVLALVKDAFAKVSSKTNITVGLQYNGATKTYKIEFPQNVRLGVTAHTDRDFSNRLGYESRINITSSTIAVPMDGSNTKVDAEGQSRALCFDTVMAVVTMDSSSSTTTDGLDDTMMACLFPTGSGSMSMTNPPLVTSEGPHRQLLPRSVHLPSVSSGNRIVPFQFNVWTMTKDSKKVPLNWKIPFSIGGVLEGRI